MEVHPLRFTDVGKLAKLKCAKIYRFTADIAPHVLALLTQSDFKTTKLQNMMMSRIRLTLHMQISARNLSLVGTHLWWRFVSDTPRAYPHGRFLQNFLKLYAKGYHVLGAEF